jgi:hypothetical protein
MVDKMNDPLVNLLINDPSLFAFLIIIFGAIIGTSLALYTNEKDKRNKKINKL